MDPTKHAESVTIETSRAALSQLSASTEREKEMAGEMDSIKKENLKFFEFVMKHHTFVPMDKIMGPLGEACCFCNKLSESAADPKNHEPGCELAKLLSTQ